MAVQTDDSKDEVFETRKVTKEEAAFILGQGGKTKAKLCAVSGAQIELTDSRGDRSSGSVLQIRGTAKQIAYARKYVEFVIAQRSGPVQIEDVKAHDDLTILVVPADTVSFITGKQGSFLRLVEEEWSALLFFLQVNPKNPPAHVDPSRTERLAIFGLERRRRGAELKVMAAIEMKMPGYFTKGLTTCESAEEGFATDYMTIKEDDYSYVLGKSGSTRKKLARASNCIVEYVGRVAYFSGLKKERVCAREYLLWLLQQRVGQQVHVDHKGRDDVTMIMVSSQYVGFVTGHKGSTLRSIEEETNTFCFIDGSADDGEDQKPLLIFGCHEDRRYAEAMVWEKISQKWDETGEYGSYSGHRRTKGKGGKGEGKGKGRNSYFHEVSEPERAPIKKDAASDVISITDDDAAFLMGPGGKTKRKIAAVSGAHLELKTNRLEITGTAEERQKANKYIQLVMAQRVGPVRIEDVNQHDDLSIVDVPAEAVSFVTGKQGSFLRLVEEEFGTLLFFLDFNKSSKRDQVERLAIFGSERERRGAELKVMAAVEMKQPGYFIKRDAHVPLEDMAEGFATDRMPIDDEDYSYALGKGGATRKKIARASGCVIEYIGRLAYLSGTKKQRIRAREYLGWLFRQRVGPVEVEYGSREDVTVLQVPKDCVGFVTGHKGMSLRAVEDATGTFCFIEGGRDDPHRDPKPLLIFGGPQARRAAEERLRHRIDQKLVEGWVHEEYQSSLGGDGRGGNYCSYNGYGGYSGYGSYGGYSGYGNQHGGYGSYSGSGNSWDAKGYSDKSDRGGDKGGGKGGDKGGEKGMGRREGGKRSGQGDWAGRSGGTLGEERGAGASAEYGSPSSSGTYDLPLASVGARVHHDEVANVAASEDDGDWGDWGGSDDEPAPTGSTAVGPPLPTPGTPTGTARMAWSQAVRRSPPSPIATR